MTVKRSGKVKPLTVMQWTIIHCLGKSKLSDWKSDYSLTSLKKKFSGMSSRVLGIPTQLWKRSQ